MASGLLKRCSLTKPAVAPLHCGAIGVREARRKEELMSALPLLAVFGGAGCGAVLRWWLGGWLNPLFPYIPMGTVAANLGGGLLIGLASGYFLQHGGVAPEWRLFVITGFLGGLTTFSTFSAEVFGLIARQQYAWAAAAAALHLVGSLALTAVGFGLARALLARGG